jgi:hypothetical protein
VIERYALVLVAVVFFGFMYRDERALNQLEDRMEDVVSTLPSSVRVVSSIRDPSLRLNPLAHMLDRVCIGRCYSYANYEPCTNAFRVRVTGPNRIVAATYDESWSLQTGKHLLTEADLPLYSVEADPQTRLRIKVLKTGLPTGSTEMSVFGRPAPAAQRANGVSRVDSPRRARS